jgi:hypothetical protein
MKTGRLFSFISLILSLSFRLTAQDLQFYREDILFTIDGYSAQTDAKYYFCNVGEKDIRMSLFYPFPGNTLELIDSLVITETFSDSLIAYRRAASGIFFEISVKAYGTSAYRVYFRQKLLENHFKYILTSTSAWGRPMDYAKYELLLPSPLEIDSLSISPDTSFRENKMFHYRWKKVDYMPDRDFEVFFHVK